MLLGFNWPLWFCKFVCRSAYSNKVQNYMYNILPSSTSGWVLSICIHWNQTGQAVSNGMPFSSINEFVVRFYLILHSKCTLHFCGMIYLLDSTIEPPNNNLKSFTLRHIEESLDLFTIHIYCTRLTRCSYITKYVWECGNVIYEDLYNCPWAFGCSNHGQ